MPPSLFNHLALPIPRQFPDMLNQRVSSHATGLPACELDVAAVYDRPKWRKITDLRAREACWLG